MGEGHVRLNASVRAPIGVVFERVSDHDDVAHWPGVSGARLIKEGTPRNGVGAVREVRHVFFSIYEEVVAFEPPRRFEYSIIKGMPITHRGTFSLSEKEGVVELVWEIRISSRVPLLAKFLELALSRGGKKVLDYLVSAAERSAQSAPQISR
jgi:hypothetical protein